LTFIIENELRNIKLYNHKPRRFYTKHTTINRFF